MTPSEHFDKIVGWFKTVGEVKYNKGQKEHGGRLWRKNTIHMLGEEILDLPTYFYVLLKQYEQALDQLNLAITKDKACKSPLEVMVHVRNAYNILQVGNTDGIAEEEK